MPRSAGNPHFGFSLNGLPPTPTSYTSMIARQSPFRLRWERERNHVSRGASPSLT